MKCHYIFDPEVGKVLIPGCDGSAIMGIENCTCRNNLPKPNNEESIEIKELRKENARLNRVIKKLLQ